MSVTCCNIIFKNHTRKFTLIVINLISETMLGHWDVSPSISQCEYQFGQRLIYVQHPKGESHLQYIVKAQETVVDAWNEIESAICFAEQLSRDLIPDFWRAHDESKKSGARLEVYSIHYDLNAPHLTYVIGVNHNFDFEDITFADEDLWKVNPIIKELPEPPEYFWILINRIRVNHFEKYNKVTCNKS